MKNKVFLGGTRNGFPWRNILINKTNKPMFNPIVEDYTIECQKREKYEKEIECDIHLYVIISPMKGVFSMKGIFSMEEVMDSINNKSKKTILHILPEGFDEDQLKSLEAIVSLVNDRGGVAYTHPNLEKTIMVINNIR